MPMDRSDAWRVGNIKTVSYCTLCVVFVGFAMLLAGAILTGIAYTEVRPNFADENYDRYIKANLNRVVGPVMLAFGMLNIVGGCVFFGVALFSSSRTHQQAKKKYNDGVNFENQPDADKKMLNQA